MTLYSEKRHLFADLPRGMKYHNWQKEAVSKFAYNTGIIESDAVVNISNDFLAVVVPGGGKTLFAEACCYLALKVGKIDYVVYINPSKDLKQQVKDSYQKYVGLELVLFNHDLTLVSRDHIAGQVISYQCLSYSENVEYFKQLCLQFNVLVIADECHHLAENGKAWGDNYIEAFDNASYRLALTGTPYRSKSTERIPYIKTVSVGSKLERYVYDYEYTRSQALKDGVICNLQCSPIALSEDCLELNKPQIFQVANYHLFNLLMSRSYQLWKSCLSDHEDALMLLYVSDTNEAQKALDYINRYYPDLNPIRVDSKSNVNASAVIKGVSSKKYFMDHHCLISVKMLSEGVDIKQVRVISLFTQFTTRLFVNQSIARASRIDSSSKAGNNDSYVVYVAHPELQRYINEFGLEVVKLRMSTERWGIAPMGDYELVDPDIVTGYYDNLIVMGDGTAQNPHQTVSNSDFERALQIAESKGLPLPMVMRHQIYVMENGKMRQMTFDEMAQIDPNED